MKPVDSQRDRVADLRPVDLAVLGNVDPDRVVRVRDQHFARVGGPRGAGAVGLASLARDPANAADDLLDQVVVAAVLGVRGAEMTHRRDPRTAVVVRLRRAGVVVDVVAVVELAPRDRVVLAHRVAARRVRALVDRREDVMRAADVAAEVVVLVTEAVGVGQVARRDGSVGHLDLADVRRAGRRVAGHRGADDGIGVVAVPPVPRLSRGAHVRRVVDAGDTAAVLDVLDDRRLLRVAPQGPRRYRPRSSIDDAS